MNKYAKRPRGVSAGQVGGAAGGILSYQGVISELRISMNGTHRQTSESSVLDLRVNPIHECRVYDKHGKLIRVHTREELIAKASAKAKAIKLTRNINL